MCAASPDSPAAIESLKEVLQSGNLITDPSVKESFETDWTGRFGSESMAVARPRNTKEVVDVLEVCREFGLTVVTQGGNTGLAGGGVPQAGCKSESTLILSMTGLDEIGSVDHASGQIEVGAGVTLADLQAVAAAENLSAGLDLAARDSATVGGLVACDAGGAKAIRYGTARQMVAGVEAVTGDGRVIRRMSGLEKDNSGFGLPDLLIGSEGTLAVITAVRWKLAPLLPAKATALVGLESMDEAVDLLIRLRSNLGSIEAFEFICGPSFELAREHLDRPPFFDGAAPAVYLLIDCVDDSSPLDQMVEELSEAGIERALLVDDTAASEKLWECRERLTEVINSLGVPLKLDVGVPVRSMPEFIERVDPLVRQLAPDSTPVLFGHLGDGNTHVNVLNGGDADPEIAAAVIDLVLSLEGTMSAEHGVGVSKAAWLEDALDPDEVLAMRQLKSVLDPDWMLNPGVVFAEPSNRI